MLQRCRASRRGHDATPIASISRDGGDNRQSAAWHCRVAAQYRSLRRSSSQAWLCSVYSSC
jgi:hypothetical protein